MLELTDEVREADILVGHSSGCYLIPKVTDSKTVFLIGLPYWPGRTLFSSIVRKLAGEISYHRRNKGLGWWLNKILHNTWYILSRPSATYFGITKHRPENLPDGMKNKVLLVRPSDDTFCHPYVIKLLPGANNYKFIEVPGAHDDCWVNPKPYINLLLKEL